MEFPSSKWKDYLPTVTRCRHTPHTPNWWTILPRFFSCFDFVGSKFGHLAHGDMVTWWVRSSLKYAPSKRKIRLLPPVEARERLGFRELWSLQAWDSFLAMRVVWKASKQKGNLRNFSWKRWSLASKCYWLITFQIIRLQKQLWFSWCKGSCSNQLMQECLPNQPHELTKRCVNSAPPPPHKMFLGPIY